MVNSQKGDLIRTNIPFFEEKHHLSAHWDNQGSVFAFKAQENNMSDTHTPEPLVHYAEKHLDAEMLLKELWLGGSPTFCKIMKRDWEVFLLDMGIITTPWYAQKELKV